MTVTRDDVARRAGTSTAVVSYVVNEGPRPVAKATRARVLKAIDDLGYRPNRIAQALSSRRSGALGLVLPDSSNPFFAGLSRELEHATAARGYVLLLGNAGQDAQAELRHLEALLDRKVDGLLLISASGSPRSLKVLADAGIPYILLDRISRAPGAIVVRVDNEEGGYIATRHLIEHGHCRIMHLAGPRQLSGSSGSRERAAGYRRAMREAALEPLPEMSCAFDLAHAYDAARTILSNIDRPTAVFVGSDIQGLGLLRAAADCGVLVPQELAVIAFDGIPESAYSIPRLATVAQPIKDMASFAATRLIDAIEQGRIANHHAGVHTMSPRLIRRASCGCTDGEHS